MTDFDEQWANFMKDEYITRFKGQFDFTDKRVKEFLQTTFVKSWPPKGFIYQK